MKRLLILLVVLTFSKLNLAHDYIKFNNNNYMQEDTSLFYKQLCSKLSDNGYSKKGEVKISRYQFTQFKIDDSLDITESIRLLNDKDSKFWIDIVVYNYKDSSSASRVAETVGNYKALDIIFKEWSKLIMLDSQLVVIKLSCTHGKDIPEKIDEILKSDFKIKPIINCRCGGFCNVNE